MWRNKHFKDKRNHIARAQYVRCRNNVVKIAKSSVNTYFRKKCENYHGSSKLRKLPRATTNVQKNKSYVGLFISYVGLFISYVGLIKSYVGLYNSYVGDKIS